MSNTTSYKVQVNFSYTQDDNNPLHKISTDNPDQQNITTNSEDKGTTKRRTNKIGNKFYFKVTNVDNKNLRQLK